MRAVLEQTLARARRLGATYADIRWVERVEEPVTIRNESVTSVADCRDRGLGLRILAEGGWGFATCPDLREEDLAGAVQEALAMAKASGRVRARPVTLSPMTPVEDSYRSPRKEDPFAVPLEQRLGFLRELVGAMRRQPLKIQLATAQLSACREHRVFASTEGTFVTQDVVETGLSLSATAAEGGEAQRRSFANHAQAGFEFVRGLDAHAIAHELAVEATDLLEAPVCPAGIHDVVLGSQLLAAQIHETCGHPAELDRALGHEAGFGGGSFLTTDGRGSLRYGSPEVTIVADASLPGALGTFAYDDEGVRAQRADVVRDGIFHSFLMSRDTAPLVGLASNGSVRAESWRNPPLIRMTNLSLEPGDWTLPDLLRDTGAGLYLDTPSSWSLDDRRLDFRFGCEVVREIRDGALGRLYRNGAYGGSTLDFWQACDAVTTKHHRKLWGLPDCTKGEPAQIAHVAHGASPARFRAIKVGAGR